MGGEREGEGDKSREGERAKRSSVNFINIL